ncbi:unnamed protein product [Microthlaspi erraticum]|uniref:Uncharacterized protein n=1 Tax=Microthlaspi erraticum TaxID=1685480 RepID=A0A6D2KIG6_9BRAS|nr:unnamed protein product [Microthlaspi erraticum]
MDFIKTSSLRALIELTFQRNWNGLIWMSRKGVIAKRVKTVPALSRIRAKPCRRPAEERSSRPKFDSSGRARITTRETMSRGRPTTTTHATPRTTTPREPGSKPRGRAQLTYHGRCAVRAGKHVPRPAEKHRPIFTRPTTRPTEKSSGHDRSDTPRPDCPADRPDRPSERRGRPEAVFEAQSAQFKPKAGAD